MQFIAPSRDIAGVSYTVVRYFPELRPHLRTSPRRAEAKLAPLEAFVTDDLESDFMPPRVVTLFYVIEIAARTAGQKTKARCNERFIHVDFLCSRD